VLGLRASWAQWEDSCPGASRDLSLAASSQKGDPQKLKEVLSDCCTDGLLTQALFMQDFLNSFSIFGNVAQRG
jgi:hypothetical protein